MTTEKAVPRKRTNFDTLDGKLLIDQEDLTALLGTTFCEGREYERNYLEADKRRIASIDGKVKSMFSDSKALRTRKRAADAAG